MLTGLRRRYAYHVALPINIMAVELEETVVLVRNSPQGFPETHRNTNPDARIGSAHNRRTNEEPTGDKTKRRSRDTIMGIGSSDKLGRPTQINAH